MAKITIIVGEFHKEIAESMIADAQKTAKSLGVQITQIVRVPGSYEVPLIAKKILEQGKCDALVVLGFIEKGDTLHGQEMGWTCSLLLKQLELMYETPIGMGIIGPGATPAQARKRISYAGRAVRAAIASLGVLNSVR